MLILAEYERSAWSPTSHHIMCEHSHKLIVIQCEKQLQDFNANGCHVAYSCLVFNYAVVMQCFYGDELSHCCVGGLLSESCIFFRLDEKLKIGLEVSKIQGCNTDTLNKSLALSFSKARVHRVLKGLVNYQCLMISRPLELLNTLCVTWGSTGPE